MKSLSVNEVWNATFEVVKKNWKPLLQIGIISNILGLIFALINLSTRYFNILYGNLPKLSELGLELAPAAINAIVLFSFFAVASIIMQLATYWPIYKSTQAPIAVADYWQGFAKISNIMLCALMLIVIVLVGLLLLVVPGIIALTALSLSFYIILEKNVGPIEAMKESYRLTKGRLWDIFLAIAVIGVTVGIAAFIATSIMGAVVALIIAGTNIKLLGLIFIIAKLIADIATFTIPMITTALIYRHLAHKEA